MGRGLRAALPRHVRLRPLGPQPRNAVPRPRPARRKASLLCLAWRWHARFRLGAEIAAGASWIQAGNRTSGGRGLPRLRLRARAVYHLQPGAQAPASLHALRAPRRRPPPPTRILGSAVHAGRAACATRRTGRADRASARCHQHPDDCRGAIGRVPIGWRRLQRGRRNDGRLFRRSRQHLLDLFRRSGVQRGGLRAEGCRPLSHTPPRRARRHR